MQVLLPVLLVIAATTAGCSSVPQAFSTTVPPPPERVLRPDMVLGPSERAPLGYVALPIVRDSALSGSACAFDIVINDVKVVQLRSGEGLVIKAPEGRMRVRLEFGGILCPVYSTSTEAVLGPRERLMLRTGIEDFRPWAVFTPAIGAPVTREDTAATPAMPSGAVQLPSAAAPPPQAPTGKDAYSAERLARESKCSANPTAVLVTRGPGYESFSVQCTNADALLIRCEMGNCRALK